MSKIFKQGEEAMYGVSRVIITGSLDFDGLHYFILYADGSSDVVRADDKCLRQINPKIIHKELLQILDKLYKKDAEDMIGQF
jgi:hypothetical protein